MEVEQETKALHFGVTAQNTTIKAKCWLLIRSHDSEIIKVASSVMKN
jgi:hypothetical protein